MSISPPPAACHLSLVTGAGPDGSAWRIQATGGAAPVQCGFHVSNLPPEVRESLLDVVDEEDLPRNVYYGDGSPIEVDLLDEVRGVLDECTIKFPWLENDVMMLDNMLAAHARSPFTGKRKVVVAMAQGYSER